MIWILYVGIGLVLLYEVVAAITHKAPTISEWIWKGATRTRWVPFIAGLLMGLLGGHLFF